MITVTLTPDALAKAGACPEGRALFTQIKTLADEQRAREGKPARKGLTVRWTQLHALWLAVAYPSFSRWLVDQGLVPATAGYGANLDGANLYGANLYGANLDGANLTRANWPSDKAPPAGWKCVPKSCRCCFMLAKDDGSVSP